MFYINATQKNIKRITRLIYHCALIVVRGSRFISEIKLLQELGWNSFQERTNYLSITMFAKIKLNCTPRIIYNKFFVNLPKNVGRNAGKLKVIFSKKNKFYNSYYFKMIRMWNNLKLQIRQCDNYPDYLDQMYKQYEVHQYKKIKLFHYDTKIDKIYLQLRFHCSKLNADQYKLNFVDNSKCNRCNKNRQETIHHFFLDCAAYDTQRNILINNIQSLDDKLKKINKRQIIQLIEGSKHFQVGYQTYKNIYQYVKLYIVTSGRFV